MSERVTLGTRVKIKFNAEKGTVVAVEDDDYVVYIDDEKMTSKWTRDEFDVFMPPTLRRINTNWDLLNLKDGLGVGHDWHEPDQHDVTAEVHGKRLDNAGFWGVDNDSKGKDYEELYVVLKVEGEPVAEVNLASLFAWATGYVS